MVSAAFLATNKHKVLQDLQLAEWLVPQSSSVDVYLGSQDKS